jgi:hypothetical protein
VLGVFSGCNHHCIQPLTHGNYMQSLATLSNSSEVVSEDINCRDCHGYRKTCGFEATGFASTGTVVDFGTLWHTAYPYRGIVGISRVYYNKVSIILLFFLILNHCFCIVSRCDTTKYGYASRASSFVFALTLTHSHPTSRKQSKLQFYVLKTN